MERDIGIERAKLMRTTFTGFGRVGGRVDERDIYFGKRRKCLPTLRLGPVTACFSLRFSCRDASTNDAIFSYAE